MADSDSSTQIPIESIRALEAENNTICTLTNPLDEDFIHSYNGVPYTVPAKSVTPFPRYLAKHLAKHLMQYILIHYGKRFTDKMIEGKRIPQTISRKELLESCMTLIDAEGLAMEKVKDDDDPSKGEKMKVVKKKKKAVSKKKEEPKKEEPKKEEETPDKE